MQWVAAALVIAIWSAAVVAGLARTRWITAAATGLAAVTMTILVAQRVGGREPASYGIMLGVSLFITAVMVAMGVIAVIVKGLARREGG